jgi:hypothetical protein
MTFGRRTFILLALSSMLAGCAADPDPADLGAGTWGGRNIELHVDDQLATLQFKCGALGRVDGTIVLEASSRFSVDGTYDPVLVQGGPRPAHYTGNLDGTRLTLDVQVDQTTLGPFELRQGQAGTFEPCNFAR